MKKIIIIGGGFSGTLTAINLARLSPVPVEISIIDDNHTPFRGIAYSTRNDSHLLNVAARNMSALADQPNHFVEWLGTRARYIDDPAPVLRERFVPRRIYGEYIHNLLQWHSKTTGAENSTQIERIEAEVDDVAVENQHATVTLAGGRTLEADRVVLAVGNRTPADFPLPGLNLKSPRYTGNPWIGWEGRLPPPDQDVLLIGTGLTMVDTVLTLLDLGWSGKITAVSRNGLLPWSHFKGFEYPDYLEEEDLPLSLRELFAIFKTHYRTAGEHNLNPAILVDKLRPLTQKIWQSFSLFEKRQFNRHLRTRWNVMRHRIAPEIHQRLQSAITQGQLEVFSGRLRHCEESSDSLKIAIEGRSGKRVIQASALINCTGPREDYSRLESRLFNNLARRGTIRFDEMNMGVRIAQDFSVPGANGDSSHILYALGSILKGTLWESIAVPELRSQAFRVANHIAGQLESSAPKSPISEVVEQVIEYSI